MSDGISINARGNFSAKNSNFAIGDIEQILQSTVGDSLSRHEQKQLVPYLRSIQEELKKPKPDEEHIAEKIIELLGKTTSVAIPIAKLFLGLKS
jgi:hypothetical protein